MAKNNQQKPSEKKSGSKPSSAKGIVGTFKGGRTVSGPPPKPQKPTKGK